MITISSHVRALSCMAAFMAAAPAWSGVYKWTDDKGVVHYTQTPPPQGDYQTMRPLPPPAAAASPARDSNEEFLKRADEARQRQREAHEAAAAQNAGKAERCSAARQRLAYLEERTPRRLAVKGDDGQYSRMTAEEWERRKAEAQQAISQNCS